MRAATGRGLITADLAEDPQAAPAAGAEAWEAEPERGPMRRCVVTREQAPKERMIRFVRAPDGAIVADLAARLPGRGLWLSARADVLDSAVSKGGLARAFARTAAGAQTAGPVRLPADLPVMLAAGLRLRIGEYLGLARRAGQAVAGFEKARAWLGSGRAALAVEASDGSAEERRRLLSGAGKVIVAWPLDAATLGQVFGRPHAVHVAVAPGRIATALIHEIDRLAGVTGETLQQQAGE